MALAVDVPGDGTVRGADGVVAGGASGGASVSGDLLTHDAVGADSIGVGDDHTAEHIGVVVVLVVDNDEDLALDANLAGEGEGVGNPANRAEAKLALTRVGLLAEAAEDTVRRGTGTATWCCKHPSRNGASGPRRSRRRPCSCSTSNRSPSSGRR